MARIGKFLRTDERLALGIASGLSIRAAAKKAGISERSAHRRVDDELFAKRVRELRAAMSAKSVGILTASVTAAARKLRGLLKSSQPSVAHRAAVAILELQAIANDNRPRYWSDVRADNFAVMREMPSGAARIADWKTAELIAQPRARFENWAALIEFERTKFLPACSGELLDAMIHVCDKYANVELTNDALVQIVKDGEK